MNERIYEHPVLENIEKGSLIPFVFNGKQLEAREGETIAAALLANGIRKLRVQEATDEPRGIYCNIGHCFECRMKVDQKNNTRACLTMVKPHMQVETQGSLPKPFENDGGI